MISSPSTSSDITPVDIISTTVTNHKIVLTGHCELAACPFGTERTVCCMASLEAPHFEEKNQERKGIDLVCVVDKSGSMAGPKLDMVISTLTFMVDQFKDKDRVAIIAFDTDVHMSLGLTKMDNEGKKKAKEVSSSISPGSCTNISDAILASLRLLAERKEKNEVTSVILFTDGLANRGLIKTSEILQSMQDVMDEILPTSNITVHTFGFGKDTDANMLTSIAQQGNGLFDFMETVDDVPKAFGNVIGNLVSVVGQNIKIKIQPKPNVCVKQIMTGYRIADLPNGAGSEVTVGDVYSGEKKDVVFILSIPKLHNPLNVQELAEVSLSYFNVIETESESIGFDLTIQRNDVLIESQSSLKLDLQRNRVLVSDAMKQAKELSDSHKLVEGRQVLTNCIAKVQQSISGKDKFCQALIQDMTRILLSMQDVQSYQYMGNRLLNNGYQQNLQQRATSNNVMNAQASFLTMPQMFYAQAFHHNVNIPSNPPNLNTLLPSLGSIFPKNNANEKQNLMR